MIILSYHFFGDIMKNKFILLLLAFITLILTTSIAFAEDVDDANNILDDGLQEDSVEASDEGVLSSGTTYYASTEGSGTGSSASDPTSFSNALSKAGNGDKIVLANGTYVKGTHYNSYSYLYSIELEGSGNTTIDANLDGGYFTTTGSVTLRNLNFINAYTAKHAEGPDSQSTGQSGDGAIEVSGSLIVANCNFQSNKQNWGVEGGAIQLSKSGTCSIYNSTFNATGGKKGTIYTEGASVYIYNTNFTNVLAKDGGAVYAKDARIELHNCSVSGAVVKEGGAISIKDGYCYIYDSIFSNSRSVDEAAAIKVKESTLYIENTLFDKLTSMGSALWFNEKGKNGSGEAGAIRIEKGSSVTIKNSNFTNCVAKADGGAIYVEGGSVSIDSCRFINNSAARENHIYAPYSGVTVTNSVFSAVVGMVTPDINVGESETTTISIDEGTNFLSVNLDVYLNEDVVASTSGTSSFQKTFTGLAAGTYTVSISSDDKSSTNSYVLSQNSSNFNVGEVTRANTSISTLARDIYEGDDAEITVALDSGVNGEVVVSMNGKTYPGTVKNGKATIVISNLVGGTYNYIVNFAGNALYNSNSTSGSFIVTKYDGEKLETNISASVSNPYAGSDVKFIVNVDDGVEGDVILKINDDYYIVALSNSKAVITVSNLTAGSYNYMVTYAGNAKYNYARTTGNLTVLKDLSKIVPSGLSLVYKSSFKARIYGKDGKAVGAGEKVVVTLNGIKYTRSTDKKGYISLVISLKPSSKNYPVTISYGNVKITKQIKVNTIFKAKNVKAKKSKSFKLKVQTKKVNGKFLTGKKLTLKFKGKKYNAKINKKGAVTFKIPKKVLKKLKTGKKYTYKVTYIKDSVSKKIKIKK